jgi:TctA family transporter
MTEGQRARVLSLWAALVSVVAIYFLTENYWKAALIGVFVGVSSVLGYGTQWVLKGSFAIAVFAIAVALGLPPPDQWLQLAHEAQETILGFRTSR